MVLAQHGFSAWSQLWAAPHCPKLSSLREVAQCQAAVPGKSDGFCLFWLSFVLALQEAQPFTISPGGTSPVLLLQAKFCNVFPAAYGDPGTSSALLFHQCPPPQPGAQLEKAEITGGCVSPRDVHRQKMGSSKKSHSGNCQSRAGRRRAAF